MSRYEHDRQDSNEIRFVEMGDYEEQEWAGYNAYQPDPYHNSAIRPRDYRDPRVEESPSGSRGEVDGRAPPVGFISAISNVSAATDDGYKGRYLKALQQLNKVLEANKKMKVQVEEISRQLTQSQINSEQPHNEQIYNEMEDLREINLRLEDKIHEILSINQDFQIEMKQQRDNFKRENEKNRQLTSKLGGQEQENYVNRQNYERQIESLNNTLNQLQNANSSFKQQEINLKDMYSGKQEANVKKILFLETQLNDTKAHLMKEREKVNTEIQSMSMKIRKETQSQLANYKLEMTRLKDINTETQREIEKLNKQIRELTDKRAQKRGSQHRYVAELQQQVESCKKEIRRLKDSISSTHQIEIQKESLEKEVKMLSNNVYSLNEENAQLKVRLNSTQQSQEELQSTSIKMDSEIKRLKIQVDRLENEIKRKETLLSRHKTQTDNLKDKLMRVQAEASGRSEIGQRKNVNEIEDRIRQLKNKVNLLSAGKHMFEEDEEEMEREKIHAINNMTSALEEKMDAVLEESEEMARKVQHYKEKASVLQKRMESGNNEVKVLASKLEAYEKLVPKLEIELEKAIKHAEFHPAPQSSAIYVNPSQNLLRDKVKEMNDRLAIEAKYAKQELETKCLQYDSKLMAAKLEVNKLKQALKGESFFHNRITELSQKLSEAENKKLELVKRIGELEREKHLAERLPVSLQKDLDKSRQTLATLMSEVEELRSILIEKEKELSREKGGRGYSKSDSRSSDFNLERQQLIDKISDLKSQNETLIRMKMAAESRSSNFEYEVARLEAKNQNQHQNSDGSNSSEPNESLLEEVQRLREENVMLKECEADYVQLERKSSIIITTFGELKSNYESLQVEKDLLVEENLRLRYQLDSYVQEINRLRGSQSTSGQSNNLMPGSNSPKGETRYYTDISPPKSPSEKSYKKGAQNSLFMRKRQSNDYEMEFKTDEDYGNLY